MLINIKGRRGSGKTLMATALATLYPQRIYPNYTLRLQNASPFSLPDFLREKYKNCLVILDEAYIYLESRTSQNKLNLVLSYLTFQSRKTGVDIILTEQLERTIDVRERESADIEIYCRANAGGIDYVFCAVEMGISKSIFFPWQVLVPFFPLFDTTEVIAGIKDMSQVIDLTSTSDQKRDDAEILADKLFAEYANQRITADVINAYCALHSVSALQRKVLIPIVRKRLKEK